MPTLSEDALAELLQPYLRTAPPPGLCPRLSLYLDLLLKWNARTNLTAIRDPAEIVQRHFGESLFAAQHLPPGIRTLLDFGSGAGFPGLPIALFRPEIAVTLAESQNKKASFLREAVRTLGISAEVWPHRVETLPEARRFDVVALRAVDGMTQAIAAAAPRATRTLLLLTNTEPPALPPGFLPHATIELPRSRTAVLLLADRQSV